MSTNSITFITGNQHKVDQYAKLLGLDLLHQKVDLEEIQSADIREVALHKINQAYDIVGKPVIIDDFGFCIDELNDLPGPFTKFFVEPADGLEKLCRITDALPNRTAKVVCAIAYKDSQQTKVFVRELRGNVSRQPRGTLGIATDMIFEPQGYGGKTRSELSVDEYNEAYLKVHPIDELKIFMQNNVQQQLA